MRTPTRFGSIRVEERHSALTNDASTSSSTRMLHPRSRVKAAGDGRDAGMAIRWMHWCPSLADGRMVATFQNMLAHGCRRTRQLRVDAGRRFRSNGGKFRSRRRGTALRCPAPILRARAPSSRHYMSTTRGVRGDRRGIRGRIANGGATPLLATGLRRAATPARVSDAARPSPARGRSLGKTGSMITLTIRAP